jgi:excisionase family DNA binding protein
MTAAQRWEAALAAARQFLTSAAAADCPDRPASEVAECLGRCREHLAALVAASRPEAPLARTVDEVAAALGISPITVYRLVNDGDLEAYRIGRRHIRIRETALEAYLSGRIVQPGEITGQDIPPQHLPSPWQ